MGFRGFIVLIVLTIAALYWGGQNFITGLKEREPLEITCADYLKHHPDNHYLRLTQCEADLDNMAIEEGKDKAINAVYIPLRAKGVTSGPTEIVLKRTDDDITRLAGQAEHLGPGDEAAAKRVSAELEAPNEGLVQFGFDLSDKDMDQLRTLNLGLSHDFIIMERGKSPRLLLGGLVLGAGLLGLAFFVRGVIKRIKRTD